MRYLKPKGTPIEIEGKIYYIKYTLDVIDELQDRLDMPMTKLLTCLTHKKTQKDAIKIILKCLIGADTEPTELDYYSTMLITTYIDQAKYKGMPTPKKSEEETEPQFVDIEYWYYIGKVILNFTTDEVWQMTLGQINTLYREHLKHTGAIKEDKVYNIDDVI